MTHAAPRRQRDRAPQAFIGRLTASKAVCRFRKRQKAVVKNGTGRKVNENYSEKDEGCDGIF